MSTLSRRDQKQPTGTDNDTDQWDLFTEGIIPLNYTRLINVLRRRWKSPKVPNKVCHRGLWWKMETSLRVESNEGSWVSSHSLVSSDRKRRVVSPIHAVSVCVFRNGGTNLFGAGNEVSLSKQGQLFLKFQFFTSPDKIVGKGISPKQSLFSFI